jgi:DNA-binding Lrp family transcriptional regulator
MTPSDAVSRLEFSLLNDYQHDFPLCSSPFATIAAAKGSDEATVVATLQRLQASGRVSRLGAVFAPRRIGVSTLAALAVPPARLPEVASLVSGFAEVNHNYEREHRFNLWFVATASSAERLAGTLAAIEAASGLAVLRLPLEEEFHIDLGFALDRVHAPRSPARLAAHAARTIGRVAGTPPAEVRLDGTAAAIAGVLQSGLPLVAEPYRALAATVGCSEAEVLRQIDDWLASGIVKRFGVVVRHRELGYTANAMVVHDIPDALVGDIGRRLALEPAITLCYRRPRVLPDWPYNLFCMIHGRQRDEVERRVAELRKSHGLEAFPHALLFSRTRFKQQGARYVDDTPQACSASPAQACGASPAQACGASPAQVCGASPAQVCGASPAQACRAASAPQERRCA